MIDRTTQILRDLIRFESISSISNLDIVNYIDEIFRTNSILARRVLSPDGQKSSLLATIGPAHRPGVVLSAHTDAVPTEGQSWRVAPLGGTIRDDRTYGRGATDMKGFIPVVLAHLPDFIVAARNTPIHLAFCYDEEVGCRGAPDLIRTLMQAVAPPSAGDRR